MYVVSETDDSGLIPPEETYIISLGAGSFFGEISLLDEVCQLYVRHGSRSRLTASVAATLIITFRTKSTVRPQIPLLVPTLSEAPENGKCEGGNIHRAAGHPRRRLQGPS